MNTSETQSARSVRALKLLSVVAVVLTGTGLYVKHRASATQGFARTVASSDASPESVPVPLLNRRLDNTDLRLRLLSAQVAALSSSAEASTASREAASVGREEPAAPPEAPTTPEAPTNLADFHERQGALLNDAIEHGPRDDWSRAKQLELTTSVSDMLRAHTDLKLTIDAVDCVATLCRLRLAPQGELDPRSVVGTLSTQMTWPGERYYKLVPGDHPSVTVYAAREGSELPRVAMVDANHPQE